MIYYITGGQRSGKSKYAQRLALQLTENPIYLATSRLWDDSHTQRINQHQAERSKNWTTIEEEKHIGRLILPGKVVVMDCVTLWLNNFFTDTHYNVEQALQLAKKEMDTFINQDFTLIIISNEIGMGVHPVTEAGHKFIDLQGWMNQHIAEFANQIVLLISGVAVKIK